MKVGEIMGSNFSTDITSGIGISLGGLEIATNFLFANPEFYEDELNETKGSSEVKVHVVKPNKPKITKQSIIDKFAIVPKTEIGIVSDTVIDSGDVILVDDSFDLDFDDFDNLEQTKKDKKSINEADADNIVDELDDTEAEALRLMKRLEGFNTESLDDNMNSNDDKEYTFTLDDLDDIDIDGIEDESSEEEIEEIEIKEESNEDEEDGISFDLDDLDEDELGEDEISDEEEIASKPVEQRSDNISNTQSIAKAADDEDEFNLDDLDEYMDDEDEPDEIASEKTDNTSNKQSTSNNSKIDSDDEDEFNLDDLDEYMDDEDGIAEETQQPAQKNIASTSASQDQQATPETKQKGLSEEAPPKEVNTSNQSTEQSKIRDSEKDKEIDEMRKQMALMQKRIQQIENAKTSNATSDISDDSNFNKKIEGAAEHVNKGQQHNNYDKYTVMNTEVLFKEVKKYMIGLGVDHKLIELAVLNEKFGTENIKKLIKKSYLINVGKGVTTGR